MKKFEIRKSSAEIRNKLDIAEGCTYLIDEDPKIINTYDSIEEARKFLASLKTSISEYSSPIGKIYSVEEYYIEENEYDEDGEWVSGGDVWDYSPITIRVECGENVKTFNNMKDADSYHTECVGGENEPYIYLW